LSPHVGHLLNLDCRIRYDSGPPNRRQHGQETTPDRTREEKRHQKGAFRALFAPSTASTVLVSQVENGIPHTACFHFRKILASTCARRAGNAFKHLLNPGHRSRERRAVCAINLKCPKHTIVGCSSSLSVVSSSHCRSPSKQSSLQRKHAKNTRSVSVKPLRWA